MQTQVNKLLGLDIITHSNGEKSNKVLDIIYDSVKNSITGLIVDNGGMLSSAKIVPFSEVMSIGEDAVIIKSDESVVELGLFEDKNSSLEEKIQVKGKIIMTEDGKDLGRVEDLVLETSTGKILGYVASGGIFSDAYSGKSYVPAPDALKVGGDVVFVPNETAQKVESQIGGLQKVVQNVKEGAVAATEKVKETASSVTEQVKEKAVIASENVKEVAQNTQQAVQEKLDQPQTKQSIDGIKIKTQEAWQGTKRAFNSLKENAQDKVEEIKNANQTQAIKTKSDDAWEELKESSQQRLNTHNNSNLQRREGDEGRIEDYIKKTTIIN